MPRATFIEPVVPLPNTSITAWPTTVAVLPSPDPPMQHGAAVTEAAAAAAARICARNIFISAGDRIGGCLLSSENR
jgi:hypothetical protein